MKYSICNLPLMRMSSTFVKNTPLGLERFYFLFFCFSERVAQCQGSLPPSFDTATLCVCVLAVGMRFRVTRGIAGSTDISKFLAF